ncbi:acyl-CoA dehydrogenase [Sphingomonas sp. Root710]|uniref:acyl-CoA dehydrogenase n=1 Tax=Sphingomonas sp. Root710 TaxID=1736594 RepID=UPI0006F1CA84|nr:acyl-CoA dehydrogenase [Sphingomonas sp. Root710]KRB86396.1 acyl-CoA dehydrogenase [Sphingomonas sp. Root710]
MSAIVNRRDIDFILYELLGLDSMLETPRYAGYDRASIEAVLDMAQQIAEEKFLPHAATVDASEPQIVEGRVEMIAEVGEALRAYADAGLFGAGFDEAIGGMQLPAVVQMMANGMFSSANIGVTNYALLTQAAANMLNVFGSDEQRRRYLPAMLEGRWFGTMCLSEPQAGSSLADIRTRAEPLADGNYRITGSKMWISGGDHQLSENIVHMVLAKIAGGPAGVKGISLFIVPRQRIAADGTAGAPNDVALAGLNHKMGHRGTTNCLLNFGENGDCLGELVGEPHQGLKYMFHMMNEARIGVGHGAVMSALAAYLYSTDYARNRLQGRHPRDKDPLSPQMPIIEHADVRRMLLAQKAAVEGGLALVAYGAWLVDRQKVVTCSEERQATARLLDLLTPVIKSWPSEHCLEANKLAIQVLGGYGYTRDYPVERLYRDNRLNHIHEGTFAIQGIDLLGRKVRLEDGVALKELIDRVTATIDRVMPLPDLAEHATRLGEALAKLRAATQVSRECDDLNLGLANATLYLDAFGTIVVAWLWLWQAELALQALATADRPAGERDFYQGKLAACRYFFRYVLPHASVQLDPVLQLENVCLSTSPDQLVGH